MNMHGIIAPASTTRLEPASPAERARRWMHVNRYFMFVVVLPTLLVASYLYLFAANQYESEAHFLVRTAEPMPLPAIGVSQAISAATGLSSGQSEAMSVADYLTSHDAVTALQHRADLVARFTRPEADLLSRLWTTKPTPERLLRYYRQQVSVDYSTETGITSLRVRTFRPTDSYIILRDLLQLGEQRVNDLNNRSFTDALAIARRQLTEAETDLAKVQVQLTRYRQSRRDIDPQASGQAQIGLVTTLTGQLAAARAQLNAMSGVISSSSPQYQALASRVRALSAQVASQSGRLTGGRSAIAEDIGGYEELKLRQQFLGKRYDVAATALQRARENALRQQLYVVRVVDANMPVKSMYPERLRILGTVLVALLLIYSIGWLLAAGVREHAM